MCVLACFFLIKYFDQVFVCCFSTSSYVKMLANLLHHRGIKVVEKARAFAAELFIRTVPRVSALAGGRCRGHHWPCGNTR